MARRIIRKQPAAQPTEGRVPEALQRERERTQKLLEDINVGQRLGDDAEWWVQTEAGWVRRSGKDRPR